MTPAPTLAAALTAVSLAFAAPVAAQQAETTAAPQLTADQVTDAQVDAFAHAILAVSKIQKEYKPKMEGADTKQAKNALAKESRGKIISAIESIDGLSVDDYVALGRLARGDKGLGRRVVDRLREIQG